MGRGDIGFAGPKNLGSLTLGNNYIEMLASPRAGNWNFEPCWCQGERSVDKGMGLRAMISTQSPEPTHSERSPHLIQSLDQSVRKSLQVGTQPVLVINIWYFIFDHREGIDARGKDRRDMARCARAWIAFDLDLQGRKKDTERRTQERFESGL